MNNISLLPLSLCLMSISAIYGMDPAMKADLILSIRASDRARFYSSIEKVIAIKQSFQPDLDRAKEQLGKEFGSILKKNIERKLCQELEEEFGQMAISDPALQASAEKELDFALEKRVCELQRKTINFFRKPLPFGKKFMISQMAKKVKPESFKLLDYHYGADRTTPLIEAVRSGNTAFVYALAVNGASLHEHNMYGKYPNDYAYASGNQAMIKLIDRLTLIIDQAEKNKEEPSFDF